MDLMEAEHGVTDMAMNNARYHGDQNLLVKFFKHPKLDGTRTAEEKRPIFKEVPYVQIMQPGNKDSIIVRPATERDKLRFAEHFRKYEAREDQDVVEGTLLEEWAGITRSQVEELRYMHIRTVEQLATVSDSNAQNVMGINFLKTKAKKYLEDASKTITAEALADLRSKYEELLAAQTEKAPKKRRRTLAAPEAEQGEQEK
jgi:vacuolar-type H+-ATPase subunit H